MGQAQVFGDAADDEHEDAAQLDDVDVYQVPASTKAAPDAGHDDRPRAPRAPGGCHDGVVGTPSMQGNSSCGTLDTGHPVVV